MPVVVVGEERKGGADCVRQRGSANLQLYGGRTVEVRTVGLTVHPRRKKSLRRRAEQRPENIPRG